MVLTQRDKKLIYMLAVIVIVVGFGALLILPQLEKHQTLAEDLDTANQQQSAMETSIANLGVLKSGNAKATEEYKEATKNFYDLMESHEAERMITQIALSHNLAMVDFAISPEPQNTQMSAYIASSMGGANGVTEEQAKAHVGGASSDSQGATANTADTFGKDVSSSESKEDSGETDESKENAQKESETKNVAVDYILLSATGTTANMQALIDDLVNNYPSLQVTSFKITTKNGISRNDTLVDNSTIEIGLNLYMVDKSE